MEHHLRALCHRRLGLRCFLGREQAFLPAGRLDRHDLHAATRTVGRDRGAAHF